MRLELWGKLCAENRPCTVTGGTDCRNRSFVGGFCILRGSVGDVAEEKPFHSFDELVALLESRGVIVDADTRIILQRESYYAVVNGYKDPFIDRWATGNSHDDRYKADTGFDEIYRLHKLDRALRAAFLPCLLVAETTLKTLIVHVFCEHYPHRDSYLQASSYDPNPPQAHAEKMIETLQKALLVKKGRHPKDFIEHYLSKYEYVPLWVLANFLTFGTVSQFYASLSAKTRAAICKEFSFYSKEVHGAAAQRIEPYRMAQLLRRLGDFRNICAHEERFYCARVGKARDVPVEKMLSDLGVVIPPSDFQNLITAVVNLLKHEGQAFRTISVDTVLLAMGFTPTDEVYGLVVDPGALSE